MNILTDVQIGFLSGLVFGQLLAVSAYLSAKLLRPQVKATEIEATQAEATEAETQISPGGEKLTEPTKAEATEAETQISPGGEKLTEPTKAEATEAETQISPGGEKLTESTGRPTNHTLMFAAKRPRPPANGFGSYIPPKKKTVFIKKGPDFIDFDNP